MTTQKTPTENQAIPLSEHGHVYEGTDKLSADCGCAMKLGDLEWAPCPLHSSSADLLAALEGLAGAVRPYLDALRTLSSPMNAIERAIYTEALAATIAIAKATSA